MQPRTIMCIIILVALVLAIVLIPILKENTVKVELVYEYRRQNVIGSGRPAWLTVYDTSFFTEDTFAKRFHDETGLELDEHFQLNTNDYTYVICYGASLDRLVYREAFMSVRFTGVYPWYYGFAYLRQDCPTDMVRIYRANKIRIENDPHSNDPNCIVI